MSVLLDLYSSMLSWLTPTALFLLLNIMIATIAISTTFGTTHKNSQSIQDSHHQHHQQSNLYRAPSLLQRFKSINFYHNYNYKPQEIEHVQETEYHFDEQNQRTQMPQNLNRAPSLLQRLTSTSLYQHYIHKPQELEHEQETEYHFEEEKKQGRTRNIPQQTHQNSAQQHLVRSPSLVQRLAAMNLFNQKSYKSQEHEQETEYESKKERNERNINRKTEQNSTQKNLVRSPSFLQRLKSRNFFHYTHDYPPHPEEKLAHDDTDEDQFGKSLEEVYSQLQGGGTHFNRSKSDTEPTSGEVPVKLSRKMKKSASTKSAFGHFEEEKVAVESRRPATVREGHGGHEDEEVDAKADDFINRFKQQLHLQRLDSIMRYKETLGRVGKGK